MRQQVDGTAILDDAPVKLIILIANQLLIEIADFFEQRATETAERHGIDLADLVGADTEVGVAHTEG